MPVGNVTVRDMLLICSIPDCARQVYARAWCSMHYQRWRHRGGDPAVRFPTRGPLPIAAEKRFWPRVDTSGGPDACWPFLGGVDHKDGYGRFWYDGDTIPAHRAALLISGITVPKATPVCHTCDNPPCCNPRHLFVGSNLDNIVDMVGKGRHGHHESHHQAKLTADQVLELRRRSGQGERNASLARAFGISKTHTTRILKGLAWK